MKKVITIRFFWLTSLLFLISPILSAQNEAETEENEPVDTYLSFIATYTSNDTVVLTAHLFIRRERIPVDLQNAPISFTASGDGQQLTIGEVFTDSTGKARCLIPTTSLPRDKEGMVTYTADFSGTDNYFSASEVFISKPAALDVSFYEEDSIKYIRVSGIQTGSEGDDAPIANETVLLFVPTLFAPMPVGEIYLEEDGVGSMEFPMTLIGDSVGTIMIIARIDENDLFGYVKGGSSCNWAIPKHFLKQDKPTRELWTPVAPLWMIITLLILLAGVWGHYVYAVVQLIKIKQSAKKESA
ncbi:MAG: hypothetical protein JXA23_03775 [Bacteroidales bacterium]|nr:hypothetical protein [Bacteroidales bacterium]